MYGYIYLVRNKINGKQYIGQKHSEVFDPSYFGSGVYLKRALNKYGSENFEHVKILEWCSTKDSLDSAERKWIDFYNAVESDDFYNLAKGGIGTTSGSKRSDSFKSKMSIAMTGKHHTDRTKSKLSQSISGRIWVCNDTHEVQIIPSELEKFESLGYHKGRLPFTEEHIKKTADSRRGHYYESEESLKLRSERMTGEGNPFYGRHHTEEKCEYWSKIRKGRIWMTKEDGSNTVIDPEDIDKYLADGWYRGMTRPKKIERSSTTIENIDDKKGIIE